jgi:L-aminopeptidase/D-esterase-like protein
MAVPSSPRRRQFLRDTTFFTVALGSAFGSASRFGSTVQDSENLGITAVGGLRVGHFADTRRPTGCSVVIFEKGAAAGVDVRGSAPGTRETDLLNPTNSVQKVNAILITGGSAFGLDAATGVMRYLEEQQAGFRVGSIVVPIVPAAVLFDLGVGDSKIRPDAEAGYKACLAATSGPVAEGNVGAGAGATVGKLMGMKSAMKSGLGTYAVHIGVSKLVVGAMVAVNAVGDVVDYKTGTILAGTRSSDGKTLAGGIKLLRGGYGLPVQQGTNTTIGIVATNAAFNKAEITKIAQMAQDGLARSINPVHTAYDGDTIFAASTGTSDIKAEVSSVGAIAAEVLAEAVGRAVRLAKGLPGLPSYSDLVGVTAAPDTHR